MRVQISLVQALVTDTGENDDHRGRWQVSIAGRCMPLPETLRFEKQNFAHRLLVLRKEQHLTARDISQMTLTRTPERTAHGPGFLIPAPDCL
jgi:hypothetical protein